MKLKMVKETNGCEGCCFSEGHTIRPLCSNATQTINGETFRCTSNYMIFQEVKESMNIEDLKKSKEMLVWNNNDKYRREIVFVRDTTVLDCCGIWWTHYEEIKGPEYRPYNAEDDLSELLGCKIKTKSNEILMHIISSIDQSGFAVNGDWFTFDVLLDQWENLDGTPLGVKL